MPKEEEKEYSEPQKYSINFTGHKTTLEELYGKEAIPVGDLIAKMWDYIVQNKMLKVVKK